MEQGVHIVVALHTVLEQYAPSGERGDFLMLLPEGATVRYVLEGLGIPVQDDALILVLNHHIAMPGAALSEGDRLDIIPAISGGTAL